VTFLNPAGAPCTTQVQITNPSTQSASTAFNPSPTIVSVPGNSGPAAGGGTLLIIGNNYFAGTTVTIGGAAATIQFISTSSILVTVPAGTPGQAPIVVTSASGCTAMSTYNYQ
jgi:hypothetical protein